jgi:hypothetical protein
MGIKRIFSRNGEWEIGRLILPLWFGWWDKPLRELKIGTV